MADENKEALREPTLKEMSGEVDSAPRLELNELVFNGKKNKFFLVLKKDGLVQKEDKKAFNKVELGESVNVIFLRIRRKLRQYRKDEKPLTTNEHNTKNDMLTLFGDAKIIKGTNDELREKYQGLKTNQIVYCLLLRENEQPELVRLPVKGSALGSKSKAKDVHDFYSYISSFKKNGADEHFYEHITHLFGIEEIGELGEYYAMTFQSGEKFTEKEDMMDLVTKSMRRVYEYITAIDLFYKTKKTEDLNKEKMQKIQEDIDVIEYPDEDIDAEDIPF